MRILEMQATFGKLDQAVLRFEPGLSVITAPNEWGKSTWCAFLTAMLYGVDTRERSGRESLAVKEKYAPWSGKPMEGRLRLEWQGTDITIERRAKGRTPLGEFRAYETATGLSVPGLSAETCGQMLVGVEKSVFCRSCFMKFSDLPVTADEALRQRLNALVTTGDETAGGQQLGRKLAELKRKIRYNKTGLLPQCQEQLTALRQQLQQVEALEEQHTRLVEQIARGQRQQQALRLHRQNLDYEASLQDRLRVERAAEEAKSARAEAEKLETLCAQAPSRRQLQEKLSQGAALREQLHSAVDIPVGSNTGPRILWAVAAMLAVAGLGLGILNQLIAGVIVVMAGIAVGIGGGVIALRHKQAKKLLEQEKNRRNQRAAELETAMQLWREQLSAREHLEQARLHAEQSKQRLQDLLALVHPVPKPAGADSLTLSSAETDERLSQLEGNLKLAGLQAAQLQGQMEQLSKAEFLRRQLEMQQQRLSRLEHYYRALEYSQAALETAMQELQRRFVPQITRRAGELFARLTGGKYGKFSIEEDLTLLAAGSGETTLRSSLWRSDGTADQMYLALRLAVWEAICPEAPLILDDALVRFDEKRLENAMELLQELGTDHQILLFTCQKREEAILRR